VAKLPGGRCWRAKSLSRVLRRVVIALLVLVPLWLVGGYFVIVKPEVDKPEKVDAVFVLGPPDGGDRFDEGYDLVESGYAANLVVSAVTQKQPRMWQLCMNGIPKARIFCFYPRPATTRGEAQKIRALAAKYGWKSIIVVTSTYHVSRARTIMKRCFTGKVLMVPARKGIGFTDWAYEYLYQTGAYLKVLVNRAC
jgi:hypothetical protein